MKFLKKNKKIIYLILLVLFLLTVVVFSFNNIDKANQFGGLIQKSVSTIQEPFSKLRVNISDGLSGVFKFKTIVDENKSLKEEISILKGENSKLQLTKNQLEELRNLSKALNYSGVTEKTGVVTGDVISMDGSNWFNLFTINCGSESGVYVDATVVNGVGLVGRVVDTGNGWSKVIGIIDESNKVSFKVMRDQSLLGIVSGNGLSGMSGYMLDGKASIIEGDKVVTTNIGIYPEGIEIGEITNIEFNNDTQLKNVTITPMVNFKSIQKVAVIL